MSWRTLRNALLLVVVFALPASAQRVPMTPAERDGAFAALGDPDRAVVIAALDHLGKRGHDDIAVQRRLANDSDVAQLVRDAPQLDDATLTKYVVVLPSLPSLISRSEDLLIAVVSNTSRDPELRHATFTALAHT